MATHNIVPRAADEGSIGTDTKRWLAGRFKTLHVGDGSGCYIELPILSTTQRNALTPQAGTLIYNTTSAHIEYYDGSEWRHEHSAANDPTSGEKAALAGTYGTLSDNNRYLTDSDPRISHLGDSAGIMQVNRKSTANMIIREDGSVIVAKYYEIMIGTKLEIEAGGVLQII